MSDTAAWAAFKRASDELLRIALEARRTATPPPKWFALRELVTGFLPELVGSWDDSPTWTTSLGFHDYYEDWYVQAPQMGLWAQLGGSTNLVRWADEWGDEHNRVPLSDLPHGDAGPTLWNCAYRLLLYVLWCDLAQPSPSGRPLVDDHALPAFGPALHAAASTRSAHEDGVLRATALRVCKTIVHNMPIAYERDRSHDVVRPQSTVHRHRVLWCLSMLKDAMRRMHFATSTPGWHPTVRALAAPLHTLDHIPVVDHATLLATPEIRLGLAAAYQAVGLCSVARHFLESASVLCDEAERRSARR